MPDTLPRLPFPTPDPLGLAPALGPLRERSPVTRVRTRVGDEAWLVTGYAQVRSLLADPRLGRSHPEPEKAARLHDGALLGGPMGDHEQERESHQRMRRLLAPAFSARRMRRLGDHVTELVDGMVDDLLARERPADLHAVLAEPLPALVICELLGVPYSDRARFRVWSTQAATIDDAAVSRAGITALGTFVAGLLDAKRDEPGEDVLSDLVAAQRDDPTLTDLMVTGMATGLLFAGHETTVNRIDAGVLRLFPDDGRGPALPSTPDEVARTVEEILRLPVPGGGRGGGLIRYAREEVEIEGTVIAAGRRRGALDRCREPGPDGVRRARGARPGASGQPAPGLRPRGAPLHRGEPRAGRAAGGVRDAARTGPDAARRRPARGAAVPRGQPHRGPAGAARHLVRSQASGGQSVEPSTPPKRTSAAG